ncbi:ATP-binding protein [Kitasatospora azatica]|uniref:ATP-binding protein n=1 Tax=Kitasatospora azatica TaxID=58347 RepID=UPI00068D3E42|nr:ATP-binding protein [Kitasatospora azatica]
MSTPTATATAITCRTASLRTSTEPSSVPELRQFARAVAQEWGVPGEVDEALALIVTELVANAVRHSGSPEVALLLSVTGLVLTVEVRDRGHWRARARRRCAEDTACNGRGLQLVAAYASVCEVSRTRSGTRVVAELRLAA